METAIKNRKTAPPIQRLAKPKKLIAFGWYGGKFSHLDWLLPQLPNCLHYCEPFAGSGAVLLNRETSPVETYNDIDGEVVNFFKVLREKKNVLIEQIGLTPFSREEFGIACELDPNLTSLERARRFYIRARQVRTGLAQTASIGRWANCKNTSRAGMSGVVSRWLGGVEQLDFIAERLLRVQIENRPAIDVIKLYDGKETLFYCAIVKGILLEVKLEGSCGTLEALRRIRRALEVTVEGHQGMESLGDGILGRISVDVVGCAGSLDPGGKRTACAKVDGWVLGLPLLDVDPAE